MLHPPQRITLFPYTTLFRSQLDSIRTLDIEVNHVVTLIKQNGGFTPCCLLGAPVVELGSDYWIYIGTNLGIAEQVRSEEHTSELQSRPHLVCRLLLEKKKNE